MAVQRADLARDFIMFCDGLEASGAEGMGEYARRGRVVAGDVLDLLPALEAERSARIEMQAARDRIIAILADQAGRACLPDAFRRRAAAAVHAEPKP